MTALQPAVQACKDLELKAIFSRTKSGAEKLASKHSSPVDIYSEDSGAGNAYFDLLFREDIQAFIIALPITLQPKYIKAALGVGKHVLSEKPVAEDIGKAEDLITFYEDNRRLEVNSATWSVAENFRFVNTFLTAREEIKKLGKITHFRTKVTANVKQGGKYFETTWRKTPEYQGGFLLDGGVHFTAGTRLLLGEENKPESLCAFTQLIQKHLPPVDTVNSIWKCKSGISGTFTASFGTTLSGDDYTVACEKGSVSVQRDLVIAREGEESEKKEKRLELVDKSGGVAPEVAAWAAGLVKGEPNPEQSPRKALADLELLEGMLKSGEKGGERVTLTRQI